MNAYDFMKKMKGYASNALRSIAKSAGVAFNSLKTVITGVKKVDLKASLLGKTFGGLKKLVNAVHSDLSIKGLVTKTIKARQEYEKLERVLTNTFQSVEVGKGALNMLTDFASKTPFHVNELTGSFVKLIKGGFNPAQDEMTKMGDLASSQGKSFNQLTDALLDAQNNKFKSLEEFGIKTKKVGSQVQMSFKGVTKTVDANGESIRKAILEYGGMKGVAGSMDTVSKSLGGRLSNLEKQFWSLLVVIGGEASGIFNGVFDGISSAIGFLSDHIAHVSIWFRELWGILKPIGLAFWGLIKSVLGFTSAGTALSGFGDVAIVVLQVLDVLSVGIVTVINWLMPFSDLIGAVTAVWIGLNLAFAVSPIGWIVIGIMTLIGVIGLVMKYTDGWGSSWKHTLNGAKLLFKSYVEFVKANFNTMIQGLMIGIDKIKLGWYKFKNTVGMGNSDDNQQMIAQITTSVEKRKQSIKQGYKDMITTAKQAKEEFSKVGISVDKEGLDRDFNALKNKFNNIGQKDKGSDAYTDWRQSQLDKKSLGGANGNKDSKDTKDMILSGGSKQTNIIVNIGKLQDKTEIHVSNSQKGIDNLGDKIREELLRAVNSVNQMQTA